MTLRVLTILSIAWFSGCAATGPTSSPKYPALVKSAVPAEAGQMVMFSPGDWFPNTVGFTDLRSSIYAATTPISVVMVVGTNAVVLEQWDDRTKTFNVMKLLKLQDITEASLDTYLSSTRLVVKSKDYSYNSFDLVSGSAIDGAKTKEFAAYLQQHVARQTVPPK
jgi:hypothetical protein